MSNAGVEKRLERVARVVVDPNAPVAAPAPAAAPGAAAVAAVTIPPAAAKAAPAGGGKAAYNSVCAVCHGAGVAGAPKFGDKAACPPRIKTELDALHASALKGK